MSRFCDVIEWQVGVMIVDVICFGHCCKATGIPIFTPLDLNLYCGRPPLHLVLYTLEGAATV